VKSLRFVVSFAFALSFVPSLASADDTSLVERARRRVQEGLVQPLAASEGKERRFSRSRPPPRERRLRVTQATGTADKSGKTFVRFAVDVRFGSGEWQKDDILGCVYTGTGQIFVKNGDAYYPASLLLGEDVEPVPGVCEAAPPPRA
jgi:hypothetical protein